MHNAQCSLHKTTHDGLVGGVETCATRAGSFPSRSWAPAQSSGRRASTPAAPFARRMSVGLVLRAVGRVRREGTMPNAQCTRRRGSSSSSVRTELPGALPPRCSPAAQPSAGRAGRYPLPAARAGGRHGRPSDRTLGSAESRILIRLISQRHSAWFARLRPSPDLRCAIVHGWGRHCSQVRPDVHPAPPVGRRAAACRVIARRRVRRSTGFVGRTIPAQCTPTHDDGLVGGVERCASPGRQLSKPVVGRPPIRRSAGVHTGGTVRPPDVGGPCAARRRPDAAGMHNAQCTMRKE